MIFSENRLPLFGIMLQHVAAKRVLGDFPPRFLLSAWLPRTAELIQQPLPEGLYILALKIRIHDHQPIAPAARHAIEQTDKLPGFDLGIKQRRASERDAIASAGRFERHVGPL